MDFGESGNWIVTVVIAILFVANFFFKKRKTESTPLGKAAVIFTELSQNQKLVENFNFHRGVKRFMTVGWQRNKDKVDFLPTELRNSLAKTFEITEEFNSRIDSARKYKSDSYMAGIDVGRLKAPLAQSKEKLQEWLQENMNNPQYMPKRRRGLFG